MDRRAFIRTLSSGLLAASVISEAQQVPRMARIGYWGRDISPAPNLPESFVQGLRDLGYVDGRNVVIEYREAKGESQQLPALAAELVALKVDVIVAASIQPALATQQATKTIPIVFASVADPVSAGLVTTLAKPGGNVTGLSPLARSWSASIWRCSSKRFQGRSGSPSCGSRAFSMNAWKGTF